MIEFETLNEGGLYCIAVETNNYLFYEIMQGIARVLVDTENADKEGLYVAEIPNLHKAAFMNKQINLPPDVSPPDISPPDMKPPAPFAKGGLVDGVDLEKSQDITVDAGEIIAPCDQLKAAITAALERDFKRGYMNDK